MSSGGVGRVIEPVRQGGNPALERPFDIYVSKICAFAKSLA